MGVAKTYSIPYMPAGTKLLMYWYELTGKEPPRGLSDGRYYLPSHHGAGEQFRFWLFREYGAEIVKFDKKAIIRFTDEQQLLMFTLRWL